MRRPRVFRNASRQWCISFTLEGEYACWRTGKWRDAVTFALHLCSLQAQALRRA